MALLTAGPTFDQAKNKINKISLKILGIQNSEIWLIDDVSKVIDEIVDYFISLLPPISIMASSSAFFKVMFGYCQYSYSKVSPSKFIFL